MKKILYSFLFVIITTLYLTVSITATTNDSVLFYTFDNKDYSGTTIYDVSGSNNDGTMLNGVTTGATGLINEAFEFDGINDYISSSNNLAYTTLSVSCWFNVDSVQDTQLVSRRDSGGGTTTNYGINIDDYNTDGDWEFVLNFRDSAWRNYYTDDYNITTGVWYHVVITMNQSDMGYIYVNNVEKGSGPVATPYTDATDSTYFGVDPATANYFDGKMENCAIYDRVLTPNERTQLYNSGSSYVPYASNSLLHDIVSYWSWDNSGNLSDLVGGNDLTNSGATFTSNGFFNGAYNYTTNDYMYKTNELSNSSLGSVSAWINPSGTATYPVFFGVSDISASSQYIIFGVDPSERLFVQFANGGSASRIRTTNSLTSDTYSFVTIISNGTTYELYINGVNETLVIDQGVNDGTWFNDLTNRDEIQIGVQHRSTGFALYWEGGIDEVSVWDKKLTQSEITQLYNSGSGLQYPFSTTSTLANISVSIKNITANDVLFVNNTNFTTDDITFNVTYQVNNSYRGSEYDNLVAYYTFDDNTSNDVTGNGNDGTDNGNTYTTGYDSQGASFDGVNDYISIGDLGEFTGFTICGWFNANNNLTTNYQHLIGGDQNYLIQEANNRISFRFDGASYFSTSNGEGIEGLGWAFVCGLSNTTQKEIYINGVLEATEIESNPSFNISNLIISDSSGNFFNGSLDEVMIFNTSLNSTQISNLYNLTQKRFIDSSITELTNQPNGNYNIQFEVDYNGTTDTSINYSYSIETINPLSNLIYNDTTGQSATFNTSSILGYVNVETSIATLYIPRITITNPLGTKVIDDANMTDAPPLPLKNTTWEYTTNLNLDIEGTWTIQVNITDQYNDEWGLTETMNVNSIPQNFTLNVSNYHILYGDTIGLTTDKLGDLYYSVNGGGSLSLCLNCNSASLSVPDLFSSFPTQGLYNITFLDTENTYEKNLMIYYDEYPVIQTTEYYMPSYYFNPDFFPDNLTAECEGNFDVYNESEYNLTYWYEWRINGATVLSGEYEPTFSITQESLTDTDVLAFYCTGTYENPINGDNHSYTISQIQMDGSDISDVDFLSFNVTPTINGFTSKNETLTRNTTQEYIMQLGMDWEYNMLYNVTAQYNSNLVNLLFNETSFYGKKTVLAWEGGYSGGYYLYPTLHFNVTTNNTLVSNHLINITLTRIYDGAEFNFTFNLTIADDKAVLKISDTSLWIDTTTSSNMLSKQFTLRANNRPAYDCSFTTGNSALDTILQINLGDGTNLFDLEQDTETLITVHLPLAPQGLHQGYVTYSCENASDSEEEVTLTQAVKYFIFSSSTSSIVVPGGGGGSSAPIVTDLNADKNICDVLVTPKSMSLDDSELLQELRIGNQESFGFDPEFSFELISGDSDLVDKLRMTNTISLVDSGKESLTGVRLSTFFLSSGSVKANLVISSTKCIDIKVPITINIEDNSGVADIINEITRDNKTIEDIVVDLSEKTFLITAKDENQEGQSFMSKTVNKVFSVLGLTMMFGLLMLFIVIPTGKYPIRYSENRFLDITARLVIWAVVTGIAGIVILVIHTMFLS